MLEQINYLWIKGLKRNKDIGCYIANKKKIVGERKFCNFVG